MSINANDFIVGLDPTGQPTITGAQLAQLVNSATPETDRGLVLVTNDVDGVPNIPNASTTPAWKRYIWLRISATYVTGYVWNPGGATDAKYLNWVSLSQAAIAPGSIQGYQIAPNTIVASNINSVSSASIQGSIVAAWLASLNPGLTAISTDGVLTTSLFTNTGLVWGDLQGSGASPGTPVIKPLAVTQTKIARQAVAGSPILNAVTPASSGQIIDNSVTARQVFSNAPTTGLVDVTNSRGNSTLEAYTVNGVDPLCNISVPKYSGQRNTTPSAIQIAAVGVSAGDVLGVNTDKNGFVTIKPPSLFTDVNVVTTANAGKVPQVASAGALDSGTWAMVAPTTLGRILQRVTTISTAKSVTTYNTSPTARPTMAAALTTTNLKLAFSAAAFTPSNAASTIIVKVILNLAALGGTTNNIAALLDTRVSATAMVSAAAGQQNSTGCPTQIELVYSIASWGTVVSSVYSAYYGCTVQQAALNSTDGATDMFGGLPVMNSMIEVTEYL